MASFGALVAGIVLCRGDGHLTAARRAFRVLSGKTADTRDARATQPLISDVWRGWGDDPLRGSLIAVVVVSRVASQNFLETHRGLKRLPEDAAAGVGGT